MEGAATNGASPAAGGNTKINATGDSRGRGNRGRRGGGAPGRGGNPRPRGREGVGRGGSQSQGRGGLGSQLQSTKAAPQPQNGDGMNNNQSQEVQRAIPQSGEEEDSDVELCFICASPVIHSSLSPCNHSTCHICALRMRALYKNRACLHCRAGLPHVPTQSFVY